MALSLVLQPRLRMIADLIPAGCRRVADVGTDHGYIPAELLLTGRVDVAIASDIGRAPLEHARRTALCYGLTGRMDLRLGDGLEAIRPGEVDAVVIAGMGGDNIVDILDRAPWTKEGLTLVLQPMSKAQVLRQWLPEHGYAIRLERLAADKGVLYPIMLVQGGPMPPATPAQAWGGFLLEEDPLWGPYLTDRILRLRRAAGALERARDPAMELRRAVFLAAVEDLTEKKGAWERANCTGS